jgi:hypothetical protein
VSKRGVKLQVNLLPEIAVENSFDLEDSLTKNLSSLFTNAFGMHCCARLMGNSWKN